MQVRKLAVEGALEFTPTIFPDQRGMFVSPYQEAPFIEATGSRLFDVAQTNFSESRRGVVRGIHFTSAPPGTAKYTCCVQGRAIDVVVDIRVGSPTFGKWDIALLDQESFRSMYLPVGVGHAFIALEERTLMSYLISDRYAPQHELAINPLDPAIGLPIPADLEPILSVRDTDAPTLAEAASAGILPRYADCLAAEVDALRRTPAGEMRGSTSARSRPAAEPAQRTDDGVTA